MNDGGEDGFREFIVFVEGGEVNESYIFRYRDDYKSVLEVGRGLLGVMC